MSRRHVALLTALLVIAGLAACGSSSGDTTASLTSQLRIVSGAQLTDTVLTPPLQALVVEVRTSGRPKPGVVVRFTSLSSADTTRGYDPTIFVGSLKSGSYTTVIEDSTNASGRVSVAVLFGTVAGEARLVVSCPELGLSDTARFTVTPGNASRVVIGVRDTLLIAGSAYSIGARGVTDQFGNPRGDSVDFSPGPNVSSVDRNGRVLVGTVVGRGAVAVRGGGALDSARFTVVPDGTMAFFYSDGGVGGSVALSKMDGTALRLLARAENPPYPNISPTDSLIAFQQQTTDASSTILLVDQRGAIRPLLSRTIMAFASGPHFSGDGQLVYFVGLTPADSAPSVWRVRTDGSALTRIAAIPPPYSDIPFLGVAPDDSRLAYTDGTGFTILDLSRGTKTRVVGYSVTSLEFSPDGKRLAYLGNTGITIINADGGSPVKLPPILPTGGDVGLAWTPDGKWLLSRAPFGPFLVSASNGEVVSVPLPAVYQMSTRF